MQMRHRPSGGGGGGGVDGESDSSRSSDAYNKGPAQGASSSVGDYTAAPFKYNTRFQAMFLPGLAILMLFGGRGVVATAVIGLMVAYTLDLGGASTATLVAYWLTLCITQIVLMVKGFYLIRLSIFYLFLLWTIGVFFLLAGFWGSLQFREVRTRWLTASVGIERVLFVVFPVPSSIILTWASVAAIGTTGAPYVMVGVLCAHYYAFSLPLPSSFAKEGADYGGGRRGATSARAQSTFILSKGASAIHATLVVLYPAALYLAFHRGGIVSGGMPLLVDLLLLTALPFLFIRSTVPSGGMWWAGVEAGSIPAWLSLLTYADLVTLVACFEYRVVFTAFAHYIMLPPPYSYAVVTVALYTGVALVALHTTGRLARLGRFPMFGIASVGAVCACAAVSAPVWMWPIPLVAAFAVVEFYYSRSLVMYFGFVAAASAAVYWFIQQTFVTVEYNFANGMSLHTLLLGILALFAFALCVPGIVSIGRHPLVATACLCAHAGGLMLAESALYLHGVQGMYPPWLIIFTSACGIALTRKLMSERRLVPFAPRLLYSMYVAKLALLLGYVEYGMASALLLCVAVSPSVLRGNVVRMTTQQGLINAASMGVGVFTTRHFVIAAVAELIYGEPLSESGLVGLSFVLTGLACLPLVNTYFPHMTSYKRANAALLACGVIFLVFEPSLDVVAVLSDVGQTLFNPRPLVHGQAMPLWPAWALSLSTLLFLLSLMGLSPLHGASGARYTLSQKATFSAVAGALFGSGLAGSYLPSQGMIVGLVAGSVALAAVFVTLVSAPSTHGTTRVLPLTFGVMEAQFVVLWAAARISFIGLPKAVAEENTNLVRVAAAALFTVLNIGIAFYIKTKVTSALSVAQKGKRAANRSRRLAALAARVSADYEILPRIGNIACMVGFVLALLVNALYLEGSETAVFFLTPLLLLLNQDDLLCRGLTDQNRYFPILLATAVALGFSSVLQVARALVSSSFVSRTGMWSGVWNLAGAALSLPSVSMFLKYMFDFERQNTTFVLLAFPVCLVPVFLASMWSARLLGLIGFVGGLGSYVMSSNMNKKALRFI